MAAELWEGVGQIENAVQSYIEGGLWERAKGCVQQMKNGEASKRLMDYIDKNYKVRAMAFLNQRAT